MHLPTISHLEFYVTSYHAVLRKHSDISTLNPGCRISEHLWKLLFIEAKGKVEDITPIVAIINCEEPCCPVSAAPH